jgi:hypothetical protein
MEEAVEEVVMMLDLMVQTVETEAEELEEHIIVQL